ncbi:hypothetical protein H9Q72_010386 [Fusarium xylarioides]|uniref:DUF7791 domain-containing protein n=1 Tax=Fusarium xylarioides TaxID=221167 RepID=A0A9P7L1T3_9HYPO|nr:hypothetical protein H9Q70_004426 [Fusarium xylarioides]KAG5761495.1 hypothetical protein H9Q72_010386 [Fusarium xylarioides]
MDLVQRLKSWTATFSSSVKLCVSSREENPFMISFSEAQRLRLHTLTQYDIKAYILERLPSTENPRVMQALAKYIVEKATGVFLWVALVVRNIRRQWHLELEPAELREIVRGFPRELDDLYRHILKELPEYSRIRAYQTLAMVPFVTGSESYIYLDLLAYSFLNDYNRNERFAREDGFKAKLSKEQKKKRRQVARTRLNGWCRGLVDFDSRGNIGYAHRSVADFLEADDNQEEMAASLNGIHPVNILSELVLARWKVQVSNGEMISGGLPYDLMILRQKHDLDHEPFQFLRGMDAVFEPELKCLDDSALRDIEVHVRGDTVSKIVLLFYASTLEPTYPVLDMLLKHNIISPDMRVNLMPDIGIFRKKEGYVSSTPNESHSIWQYFLVREFYIWLDSNEYDVNHHFVGIVERFLRIGADHRFRFSIMVVQWPNMVGTEPETEDTFTFGDPGEPETLSFRRKWRNVNNSGRDNPDEFDDAVSLYRTFSKVRTWPCEPNGPRREI